MFHFVKNFKTYWWCIRWKWKNRKWKNTRQKEKAMRKDYIRYTERRFKNAR